MGGRHPTDLTEAIDVYLQWLREHRHRAPATIDAYRGELVRFQRFAAGRRRPAAIGAIDRTLLSEYQRHVRGDEPSTSASIPRLAPATVERRLVALRGFLRHASSQGWLADDFSAAVRLDGVSERTPRTLPGHDRDAVVNALHGASLKDKRDKAFIMLLLSSGARLSEVLRLNRRDWKHNRLVLRGRGGRQRPALITSRTRRAVDEYLEARRDSSAALFVSFQPMSQHQRNNRLTAAGVRHVCRTVSTRAGVTPFGPREVRDTVGRLVQQECGNPRLTAAILGLDGLRSVASYVDPSADDPRSARPALERLGL